MLAVVAAVIARSGDDSASKAERAPVLEYVKVITPEGSEHERRVAPPVACSPSRFLCAGGSKYLHSKYLTESEKISDMCFPDRAEIHTPR